MGKQPKSEDRLFIDSSDRSIRDYSSESNSEAEERIENLDEEKGKSED